MASQKPTPPASEFRQNDSSGSNTKGSAAVPHSKNYFNLTHKISIDRHVAYELLKTMADELKFYYSCIETKASMGPRFCHAASMIWRAATIVKPIVEQVAIKAQYYDFDPQIPGNGMRSIIAVVDSCVLHLLQLLKEIKEQRTNLLFRGNYYVKELEAYVNAFVVLVKASERVYEYLCLWPKSELFVDVDDPDRRLLDLMTEVEALDQSPFFGRTMGFQFCASMARMFPLIGVSLASYSLLWDANRASATSLTGAASNLWTSGHYLINPEERAKRICQVTVNSDISFCKAFWNLTEGPLLQELPKWVSPRMAVNEIWQIPGDLQLNLETMDGRQLEVPPPSAHTGPRSLPVRVLSYHFREGMPTQNMSRVFKGATGKGGVLPRSPCLVFHVHGGGFVATSSKTHEPYLRHWAKSLNCPIISIDYSLAPENPYPRATEEIYYAYAWVLSNAERLGWTGERICFAGDSAGGLLLASTVLRLIKRNIRRLPDGLVLIYPAFLVQYSPSPSRLLSLLDPLLPLGVVARCLAAYTGNLDYLQPEVPTADSSQPQGKPEPTTQGSSEPPPKKTLRDMVNNLDGQLKRDAASAASSSQGDEEILNFIKRTCQPAKSPTGAELATEASAAEEAPVRQATGSVPVAKPSFDLTCSSSDDDEKEDRAALGQFFHRQLSRTSGGSPGSKSGTSSSSDVNEPGSDSSDVTPSSEGTPDSDDSWADLATDLRRDPKCISFTASCFDEAFLDYLRDQEYTKSSYHRFTVPLVTSKSRRVENGKKEPKPSAKREDKPGPRVAADQGSDQLRSHSSGSLANLTWASAAIGHKMGLYVMDNLSGWFDSGHAFDNRNLLNGNEAAPVGPTPTPRAPATSPLAKFHEMPVPHDPFLSPLLTPEDWLHRFPRTAIVACHLDPLLDDSVSFAKRLKRAGVNVTLDLLDSLPHGFLNFAMFSAECREGARVCVQRMREILKIARERS